MSLLPELPRKSKRALVRCVRGASALEFALIAPVFILFLMGIFSGSRIFYARDTANQYAREAARGVALGYMTAGEAKTYAETETELMLGVDVNVTIDPPTPGDATDRDVVVAIAIPAAQLGNYAPFSNVMTDGIDVTVKMRSVNED